MNVLTLLTLRIAIVAFTIGAGATAAQVAPKSPEIIAFEECAKRVFATTKAVRAIHSQCSAELEAFTAKHDERAREVLRQKALADTERQIRSQRR